MHLIRVGPSHGLTRATHTRYALCPAHADEYVPGEGAFLTKTMSSRIRIRCVPIPEGAPYATA